MIANQKIKFNNCEKLKMANDMVWTNKQDSLHLELNVYTIKQRL